MILTAALTGAAQTGNKKPRRRCAGGNCFMRLARLPPAADCGRRAAGL